MHLVASIRPSHTHDFDFLWALWYGKGPRSFQCVGCMSSPSFVTFRNTSLVVPVSNTCQATVEPHYAKNRWNYDIKKQHIKLHDFYSMTAWVFPWWPDILSPALLYRYKGSFLISFFLLNLRCQRICISFFEKATVWIIVWEDVLNGIVLSWPHFRKYDYIE